VIGIAEELACPFGGSVGGDGLKIEIGFRKRNSLIFPVNGRGGGKDEMVDLKFFADFEQHHCSTYIHILIKEGMFNGGSYPGSCGKVEDRIDPILFEEVFEMVTIPYIARDHREGARIVVADLLDVFDF